MKELDIDSLLEKAEELKALFVLGHKVIPFLEDIFLFFKEIKPLLDDVNNSIEENIKKMPNVSKQLSKVTEATESATTHIMDLVDSIQFKTNILNENIDEIYKLYNEQVNKPTNFSDILDKIKNIDENNPDEVNKLISDLKSLKKNKPEDCQQVINDSKDIISSIQEDSNNIMLSLQVQDITSQQLAAINHLLSTIQEKLKSILSRFSKNEIENITINTNLYQERTDVTSLHKQIAFDPDAIDSITNKDTRQDDVDRLIETAMNEEYNEFDIDYNKTKQDNEGPVSQDDIDALFENQ